VAPFQRGYAPTSVPADGRYQIGALVQDANVLHDALGGGADAVLIGHDWGALATYGAVAHQPERWHRAVTAAVPPTASIGMSLFTYAQLQKSWYMFFFLSPLAELALPLDDYSFIDHLWRDWSPGYDGAWDVARVKESIGDPEHIVAAIGYYRALYDSSLQVPELADEQAASLLPTPKPTLYLHGRDDNCMLLSSMGSPLDFMADGSALEIVDDAGHFLHVERPEVVNPRIVSFLTAP
jgi:pimeloyl-ACP methyl ester carboxylesterase